MPAPANHPTRRALLIGGGVAGLVVAWELWPRTYRPNLAAGADETVLGAFLKIDRTGRVTVAVPQAELGQGVWTALPQALADELGADWRQVAVEPAPVNPLYANRLLAGEWDEDALPGWAKGIAGWAGGEWAVRHALMLTAGSTSIRAFERPFREAGAAARALLCMAAGKRIGADWRACDTEAGFVVRGTDRFRFGELATEAATFTPPDPLPLRRPGEGRISGRRMPRLDLPAKVDGSVRYAGDVRLPNMLFASIAHGPAGDTRLAGADLAAADAVAGVAKVVRTDRWVAALADTWWAADRALERMRPRFQTQGPLPDSAGMDRALDAALAGGGTRLVAVGGPEPRLAGPGVVSATYAVPFAAHAALEPLCATARVTGDRVEVWAPTQAPAAMRAAIGRATGRAEGRVTLYPTQAGGGFGRKLEVDAACEAALLAVHAGRPVQLTWSRAEEQRAGRHRPPARARLAAQLSGPRIAAWEAVVATPAAVRALGGRLAPDLSWRGGEAEHAAIVGAVPPYAAGRLAVAHAPVDLGVAPGIGRAGAHAHTAFFTEAFADELAAAAGLDPLSFRMGLLGAQPRLARCLAQAAATGGWRGEPGAGQGLACHSAFGSHAALFAEAGVEDGRVAVRRLVAVVDCGRLVNPDIVWSQIENGLAWGLGEALGTGVTYRAGLAEPLQLGELRLPRLADMPEVEVAVLPSNEAPGGVAELAIPLVAPAVANAVASATGKRLRSLPLSVA